MKLNKNTKIIGLIALPVLLVLVIFVLFFSISTPKISVEPTSFNFGFVEKEKGNANHEFEVKNIGNADLEILTTSTSCGCTTAKLGKNILKPGESTNLTVSFNPNFHKEPEGSFERVVYIKSNDPENKEIEVTIFVEGIK